MLSVNNPLDQKNVLITIEFVRIGEIDTMNEKYNAEILIETKWLSNEDIVEYNSERHWNPKLYIENALQEPKEKIKHTVYRENGEVWITETRFVKGTFWERLELQNFPIDIQELSITLTTKLTQNQIKLISDPQKLSSVNMEAKHTFIEQQKWKLYRLVKISEQASYDSGSTASLNEVSYDLISSKNPFKNPKLVATCYCSRKPGYYIFNAYFLIFLITVSALTIFSVDCKLPQNRLQTTYTLLLTSVSFKWVINRSLPTISYLTSLDKYAIICIFFVCLLCVWHAIVGAFWAAAEAREYDKWLLLAFSVIFILIHVGFIVWYLVAYKEIRDLKRKEKLFIDNVKRQMHAKNIIMTKV